MEAQASSKRWAAIVATVAALAFLAGMAARGTVQRNSNPTASATGTASMTGAGPTRAVAAMPVGFSRDEPGARAAAVAFAAVVPQRSLFFTREQLTSAVHAVAAQGAQATLSAQVLADFDNAQPKLTAGKGPTWWAVAPLAVRVDAFSPERARISVWVVRALSKQDVVVPQASWATVTVELVWEGDDWRIWSQVAMPGPTPAADGSDAPATAEGLNTRLSGFTLLDTAPH